MTASTIAQCYNAICSDPDLSPFLNLESDAMCLYALYTMDVEVTSMPGTLKFAWHEYHWPCKTLAISDARIAVKVPLIFGKDWTLTSHGNEYQLDCTYSMNSMLASVFDFPENEIALWNLQPLLDRDLCWTSFEAPFIAVSEFQVDCKKLFTNRRFIARSDYHTLSLSPVHLTKQPHDRVINSFISDYVFLEVPLDYSVHLLFVELKVNKKEIMPLDMAQAIYLHSTKQAEIWAIPWISESNVVCEDAGSVWSFIQDTFEWFESTEDQPAFTQIYGNIVVNQNLEPDVKLTILNINYSFSCLPKIINTTPLQSSQHALEELIEVWKI